MLTPGLMVMESAAFAVFEAESVTVTVKLAVPTDGDPPEMTPVEAFKLRPTAARLGPPDVTAQV